MNRMPRLSKSGIEYLDYQWGIFSGCHNHLVGICGGGGKEFNCWAQGIAYRFPNLYPDGFEPHYYPEAIDSPKHLKKPSIIGVGWVGDVIGYGIVFREQIFETIRQCPRHTFLFLTKNPEQLVNWGNFPDNCWVGVTATNQETFYEAAKSLADIEVAVKYISVEPMLGRIFFPAWIGQVLNWLIIGAQTKPYKSPRAEDVEELVEHCFKAVIPVFLKDNLNPLFLKEFPPIPRENFGCWNLPDWAIDREAKNKGLLKLRQEMPE